MKTIFAFIGFVALAAAAPQSVAEPIPIVRQSSEINPDGSNRHSYETGNGIIVEESRALRNIGAEEPAMHVEGQFQYTADDGTPIQVTYTADENGFIPQGSHLPTPPPITKTVL